MQQSVGNLLASNVAAEHFSTNRMPTVLLPSTPGVSFYCDPVTGCFVPLRDSNPAFRQDPTLPTDPRLWTREDVARWLHYVATLHGLPAIQMERFLMNGKALCLMTMDMFVQRVPLGGKLLYKDFQLRLCSAMYTR